MLYAMLTQGEEYTDKGQDFFEDRSRERALRSLSLRAKQLRMQIAATEQMT